MRLTLTDVSWKKDIARYAVLETRLVREVDTLQGSDSTITVNSENKYAFALFNVSVYKTTKWKDILCNGLERSSRDLTTDAISQFAWK
jgi:hypothetical protein